MDSPLGDDSVGLADVKLSFVHKIIPLLRREKGSVRRTNLVNVRLYEYIFKIETDNLPRH